MDLSGVTLIHIAVVMEDLTGCQNGTLSAEESEQSKTPVENVPRCVGNFFSFPFYVSYEELQFLVLIVENQRS